MKIILSPAKKMNMDLEHSGPMGLPVFLKQTEEILSAFYGVLKAMDGVTPYRLEMQAKASIGGKKICMSYGEADYMRLSEMKAELSLILHQKSIPSV